MHGSIEHGLHIQPASRFSLASFSDAGWTSCVDGRRSTSGFCVFLRPNIVSWNSSKQKVVARSSMSEYKALDHKTTQATWLQALLKGLQVSSASCPVIRCDNIGSNLHCCKPSCPCSHQTHLLYSTKCCKRS